MNLVPMMGLIKAVFAQLCLSLGVEALHHNNKSTMICMDIKGLFGPYEYLFDRFWHWGLVRNIWRGNGTTLHKYICILLHLTQFLHSVPGVLPSSLMSMMTGLYVHCVA